MAPTNDHNSKTDRNTVAETGPHETGEFKPRLIVVSGMMLGLQIELGNDPNAVDKNGETAMHAAAYKNVADAVRYLASHGANPNVWNQPNKHGWTPLTIAQGYRFGNFKPSPPTVEALLEVMKAQHVPIKEYKKASAGGD